MKPSELPKFDLVYFASPYSKYPGGIEKAFTDIAALAAKVMREGVNVYSPIAHTHPLAVHGKVDPYDHAIWLPFNQAIMGKADAMIVATMETWDQSKGIAHEIEYFKSAGKPIFYLDPETLEVN